KPRARYPDVELFNKKDKYNYKLFKLNIRTKLVSNSNYYPSGLEQVFYIYNKLRGQTI
ncbi:hypothetical protein P170DRAFT_351010, partial [Aspergillus steynii IBT 23096]